MDTSPIVYADTGFAKPWIEWHGPGGHAPSQTLIMDGEPVPVQSVGCCRTHDLPHTEECEGGFEFVCPLENGLYAISIVEGTESSVWLTPDYKDLGGLLRTETGVKIDPACQGAQCESCSHALCFDLTSYESRDELMAKLAEWSGWTVER